MLSRYGDLLEARELTFLNSYAAVSAEAQCLFVRLVSRVGPWFRSGRLEYPEIGDLEGPLEELLKAGLAREAKALEPDMLPGLFTVAELRRGSPELPRGVRKSELLEALAERAPGSAELRKRLLPAERVVAPEHCDTVALLQVLFFGNRRQGLTDFVLADLGIARYYPYTLEREQRVFSDRAALEEYLALGALADEAWTLREAGEAHALRWACMGLPPDPCPTDPCCDLGRIAPPGRWSASTKGSGRWPSTSAVSCTRHGSDGRGCWRRAAILRPRWRYAR